MACLVKGLTVVSAFHARRNEAVCLGNEDNAPACPKNPSVRDTRKLEPWAILSSWLPLGVGPWMSSMMLIVRTEANEPSGPGEDTVQAEDQAKQGVWVRVGESYGKNTQTF